MGFYTDASDLSMGGVMNTFWFTARREDNLKYKHINIKELFAIAAAIFIWGKQWGDKNIDLY